MNDVLEMLKRYEEYNRRIKRAIFEARLAELLRREEEAEAAFVRVFFLVEPETPTEPQTPTPEEQPRREGFGVPRDTFGDPLDYADMGDDWVGPEPTLEELTEEGYDIDCDAYVDELLREQEARDAGNVLDHDWYYGELDEELDSADDWETEPTIPFGWDRPTYRKRPTKRRLYNDNATYFRRVKQLATSWNCERNLAEGLLASAVSQSETLTRFLRFKMMIGERVPNRGRPPRFLFPRPSKHVSAHLREN